ncbi:hypothetical protein [Azospirillum sp. TSO22-1]|uniref:hypothetical protein n=1 Tax=Azospirillum sp. TSO22-1 TaxID=716789 RepID=UPI000D6077CE|nr:hypothetical protein [Azospirillum sp. TSO22-1]PWC52357.1 hypothetical protein TSO221_14965 [Azospirillum sp. TSO22-1]
MTDSSADASSVHYGPPMPPRRRRLRAPVIVLLAVLVMAGAMGGASWTGYRYADEAFVRYNLNRIAALSDRLWRTPKAVAVVALGSSPLRDATLDETAMGRLAARRGVPGLHFLRIVNEPAQFADFEPLLESILKLRPALVLLDRDLLFAERRDSYFYPVYLSRLGEMVERGRPMLRDEMALQYRRPCSRRESPDWVGDPGLYVEEMLAMLDLRADSPAYARVRDFVAAAQAAGIRVALLALPRPEAVEERLEAALRTSLDDVAELPRVSVWHYPRALDDRRDFCDFAHLAPEPRNLYAAWLADQIAGALAKPAAEEVSVLPP